MSEPKKRTDVIETHWEHALTWGILGIVCTIVGSLFLKYNNYFGISFLSFSYPFLTIGIGMIGYSIYRGMRTRKEPSFTASCPYCNHEMEFIETPDEDFRCDGCNRRVPVKDGRILAVQGIRCGFCTALNYMSEKTEVLICEQCDREIPLLNVETGELRHAPRGFARVDDSSVYEFRLVEVGRDKEAVINSLQHMLALNRNQIKPMLENLPATLLTGINRRKAEMLRAQLEASGATAEFKSMGGTEPD